MSSETSRHGHEPSRPAANRAMPFSDRWKVWANSSGHDRPEHADAANKQAWCSGRRCGTVSAGPAGPWRAEC
jgi:hypothetical protein